jgi:multiple sugar transport system permease protein
MKSKKLKIGNLFIIIVLILGAVIMVMPFWLMAVISFETNIESMSIPPHLFPPQLYLQNYIKLFSQLNFGTYFLNTILVTIALIISQVLFCAMAGYAFARLYFPFKNFVFLIYLSVEMIPAVVLIIPSYIIASKIHLVNSLWGVIVFLVFSGFGVFLYRQQFLSMPVELEEAAVVDGANLWQIFWRIVFPLASNVTISFGLLVFIFAWNQFLWPLIILSSSSKYTLQVGLAMMQGRYFGNWGMEEAGALVSALPLIIIFVFAQKYIVRGIATTGFK